MKAIATVNFKGGVGKTNITWLLAQYARQIRGRKVLVVDTEAQMSLTMAVQLQENGALRHDFDGWMRIEPWPNPRIAVFMNKATLRGGSLTRETLRYWELSREVCRQKN